MRKNKLILLLSLMSFVVLFSCKRDDNAKNDRGRTLNRILFGSCSSQHNDIVGIYNYMGAQYPDLYLAMGDNIYGDFFAILPGTYAFGAMTTLIDINRFGASIELIESFTHNGLKAIAVLIAITFGLVLPSLYFLRLNRPIV